MRTIGTVGRGGERICNSRSQRRGKPSSRVRDKGFKKFVCGVVVSQKRTVVVGIKTSMRPRKKGIRGSRKDQVSRETLQKTGVGERDVETSRAAFRI